jgi:hypothetical protein
MAPIMIQLSLILSQSWDEILYFISDIHNKGVSWGAVITAILLWKKINRNKRYHARDVRMEKKIDAIMERVGVECVNLTVTESSTGSIKTSSTLRSAVLSVVRIAKRFINYLTGRQTIMEKLKSRKLWMALLAAILPIINTEFALGLDTNSILAVIGVIATYILGQAHVDAKRAENGGTSNEPAQPTNTIGDTK